MLIKSAIENIAHKTTLVVIAHRLSTIVNADIIYVLQKGRIIEQGNYHNLIKADNAFKQAVEIQRL
jgi:ABC-type multidrug transport system fused ATPase/permease subunit